MSIQATSIHKLLDFTLDANYNVAQGNGTIAAIKGPSLAIRLLARTSKGSSPGTLLHLHNALIASSICYSLP